MPSFSVPLSGLDANSQALTQIANNLSNLNTTGYKSATSNFTTLFYQNLGTSGSGDPIQTGTGVTVGSVSTDFSDGAVDSTGITSNAAIQGNGFFVLDNSGQQLYTRAGDFTVSDSGYLEAPDGSLVQGYPAVNGVVNTNSPLGALQVGSANTPAVATSNLTVGLNLDSTSAVGTTYSQPIQVYDSLGGTHSLTATFTKTGVNAWSYAVTLPGADTGASSPSTLASGNLTFDTSGNVIPTTTTVPPSDNIALTSGALSDGAADLNMTWHLFNSQGASQITQTATTSAPLSTQQDGNTSGSLLNFTIESDGTISGSFSNGTTESLGQIALANFANVQGIQNIGNNSFADSLAAGPAVIGIAGTGSFGQLQGSAVEESNVDIAAQFSDLIQAQRGYEANAHAVTTFDQVTQDTLNMKAGT